jgi:hypothetical protein
VFDMPNPLSKVIPKSKRTSITFSSDTILGRPKLLPLFGLIVTRGASIEHATNGLIRTILGAKAEPTYAMFEAVDASRVRLKLLEAAASAALTGEALKLFKAVRDVSVSAFERRNILVHHMHGSCPELPEALLVGNPRAQRIRHTERLAAMESIPKTAEAASELVDLMWPDDNTIMVYTERDIQSVADDLKVALDALDNLQQYLFFYQKPPFGPLPDFTWTPVVEGARRRLLAQPLVGEAFRKASRTSSKGAKL